MGVRQGSVGGTYHERLASEDGEGIVYCVFK